MENDKEMMRIEQKLDFFLSKHIQVHIECKNNSFFNGILLEKEKKGIYVIKERKFGLMHLFVSDIRDVEEFREAQI